MERTWENKSSTSVDIGEVVHLHDVKRSFFQFVEGIRNENYSHQKIRNARRETQAVR